MARYQPLDLFDFNPRTDLAGDEGEAWRWNTSKPGLHRAVKDYFLGRKEDD